jgi:protein-L-isoaspartate O-methyltransferase
MVVPVGGVENQDLRLIERSHDTFHTTMLEPCRFVPLLGAHGWKESPPS